MSEPTGCAGPCHRHDSYCNNCDLLVGLDGLHVVGVERDDGTALIAQPLLRRLLGLRVDRQFEIDTEVPPTGILGRGHRRSHPTSTLTRRSASCLSKRGACPPEAACAR